MNPAAPSLPEVPAVSSDVPESLLEAARAAVRQYFSSCFWFWHPDARVTDAEGVRSVIENLRENGNHEAWRVAQRLHQQFLQCR